MEVPARRLRATEDGARGDEPSSPVGWGVLDALAVLAIWAAAGHLAARTGASYIWQKAARAAVALPVVLLLARLRWRAGPADLGIARPRPGSWRWFLRFGALLGAAYLAAGALLFVVFRDVLDPYEVVELAWWNVATRRGAVTTAVGMVVMAPLTEELIYRGILYPALRKRLGVGWAVLASAAVFAGMHPLLARRPYPPVIQFLGGLIFAWAYERTRSLVHPVVLHAVGNGCACAAAIAAVERPDWVHALLS
jgi:membrane protease YdiL (CAAX protease family)